MAEFGDDLERVGSLLDQIESSVASTETVTSAFRGELDDVRGAMSSASREAQGLSRSLSSSLKTALNGLIFDGAKASDVFARLGRSVAGRAFDQATKPVAGALSGFIESGLGSILPFAQGGVIDQGRVQAFASGGIVSGATAFPMRGGTGIMGEAGPEAIMPLSRGEDGKLGVRGGGAQNVNVTMNITASDAASFQRSSTQVAATMQRAIARGARVQ